MGLLSRALHPGEYVQPANTVLVCQPPESVVTWRDILVCVVGLVAALALRLSHIPGSNTPTNWPLVITLVVILLLCGAYATVLLAKRDRLGKVVLTTTDLSFVKHSRIVSAGPLHLLQGVMSFRPHGSEVIEYWVATFHNGANIRIYANHHNGQEMADRLASMLPRP